MDKSLTVPGELKNLAVIRQFVKETAAAMGADETSIQDLVLAVDESATNVISYGYQDHPGSLEVRMDLQGDQMVVRLLDQSPPFDPTQVPPPRLNVPIEERVNGGLGIYLARQLTDEMVYRVLPGGTNELTLRKRLRDR